MIDPGFELNFSEGKAYRSSSMLYFQVKLRDFEQIGTPLWASVSLPCRFLRALPTMSP